MHGLERLINDGHHECRYFPTNFAHALVGLQDGCTYMTVYDIGGFDDALDSFGLSNWLSTAPPAIVAQVIQSADSAIAS